MESQTWKNVILKYLMKQHRINVHMYQKMCNPTEIDVHTYRNLQMNMRSKILEQFD